MPSALPPEIRKLPVSDRMRLAEQIWDSITEDCETVELSEDQKAELDRRISRHETHPDDGKPWPEVRQQLLGE